MELTLVRASIETIELETAEDFLDMFPVIRHVFGEDEDIVELDNDTDIAPVLIAVLQNKPIDQYTPSANTAETSGPLKMAVSYISRPLVLQIRFFKTYWEWATPASHLYR